MQKILNYINGELVAPISDSYLENIDPSTGKVYSLCADSDDQDVALATAAALAAFPSWSNTSSSDRSRVMLKIAALIEENIEELSLAESIDQGKPLWLAKNGEIPRAQANIHFFGTAIEHFASEAHPMGNHALNYTLRTPIGVVACISP